MVFLEENKRRVFFCAAFLAFSIFRFFCCYWTSADSAADDATTAEAAAAAATVTTAKAVAATEAAATAAEAVLQNEMGAVDSTNHRNTKTRRIAKLIAIASKIYSKETDNHYSYATFCSILQHEKCHEINSRQKINATR